MRQQFKDFRFSFTNCTGTLVFATSASHNHVGKLSEGRYLAKPNKVGFLLGFLPDQVGFLLGILLDQLRILVGILLCCVWQDIYLTRSVVHNLVRFQIPQESLI